MGHILLHRIKASGKQMAEIMGKYFIPHDACLHAELFHGVADVASVQWASGSGAEDAAAADAVLSGKGLQLRRQILWKITILYFPFMLISAFPSITDSTVTYLNSLTLMPVLQIVIMR